MPLSPSSRYRGLAAYDAPDAAGAPHATVPVRPPPPAPAGALYRHVISGVEDVEFLAWRYLGTSEGWWRIADANPLVFPLDLGAGDRLVVPAGAGGAAVRDRRF